MSKFRTSFDPPRRVKLEGFEPSTTIQEAKDECDINVIVRRAAQTGTLPVVQQSLTYGEDTEVSYHEAQTVIARAKEQFEALPSEVRLAYGNDPAKLLAALDDPAQHARLRELGVLAPAEPAKAPVEPSPSSSTTTNPTE